MLPSSFLSLQNFFERIVRYGEFADQLLKETDQSFGYVIYQKPPVGHAQVIMGAKWNQKEIERMKYVVRKKLGRGVSINVSKVAALRGTNKKRYSVG